MLKSAFQVPQPVTGAGMGAQKVTPSTASKRHSSTRKWLPSPFIGRQVLGHKLVTTQQSVSNKERSLPVQKDTWMEQMEQWTLPGRGRNRCKGPEMSVYFDSSEKPEHCTWQRSARGPWQVKGHHKVLRLPSAIWQPLPKSRVLGCLERKSFSTLPWLSICHHFSPGLIEGAEQS